MAPHRASPSSTGCVTSPELCTSGRRRAFRLLLPPPPPPPPAPHSKNPSGPPARGRRVFRMHSGEQQEVAGEPEGVGRPAGDRQTADAPPPAEASLAKGAGWLAGRLLGAQVLPTLPPPALAPADQRSVAAGSRAALLPRKAIILEREQQQQPQRCKRMRACVQQTVR
ncbi:neural Wiskott-Aldrich syndrome protein-like [Schistocerca nitens]|uniref:neural Wiskott-Aldrich syndrome protein-like n=1 Tax=Schistocerca nitens TaxID=7011 RepID=UPI002117CD3B|nr:neural Wiskott-Aldrich syndrome protein-like [Schistocerca nitens]